MFVRDTGDWQYADEYDEIEVSTSGGQGESC